MSEIKILRAASSGLILIYGDVTIGLDAAVGHGPTLLSHSHADHVVSVDLAKTLVTTQATLETLIARNGRVGRARVMTVEYGEPVSLGTVSVTALNAGHVLGSSMFLIELGDTTVLYTGDFNNVDSLVHTAAVPVEADVLVTEATYGTPHWVFPPREDIHSDIVRTAREVVNGGEVPCFSAYSLGKAQEAIALLARSGIDVVVGNFAIDAVSQVYAHHGSDLEYVSINTDAAAEILRNGGAMVVSSFRHMLYNVRRLHGPDLARRLERRSRRFDLSGWSLPHYGHGGFPLSAHTDFPGLLDFAKSVDPVIAYCFTENGRTLAASLSDTGIPAVPLE